MRRRVAIVHVADELAVLDEQLTGRGLDGIEHGDGDVGGFSGVVFGGLAIEKL
jgi:hypothetical protein